MHPRGLPQAGYTQAKDYPPRNAGFREGSRDGPSRDSSRGASARDPSASSNASSAQGQPLPPAKSAEHYRAQLLREKRECRDLKFRLSTALDKNAEHIGERAKLQKQIEEERDFFTKIIERFKQRAVSEVQHLRSDIETKRSIAEISKGYGHKKGSTAHKEAIKRINSAFKEIERKSVEGDAHCSTVFEDDEFFDEINEWVEQANKI
eukprot:GHVU01147811.1.p1 GENE.GHVU01147811.1~~GHVU01147811.1.p1  ORF type:complete len:207 (-),score=42.02 GHVU01147811.1:879-1499(-)